MNSGTDQRPAGDGRDSAKGLAALRRQRPDWHIRHASDDHPGELGYRATRDLITITAPNLTRLADRIADADRGGGPAPGVCPPAPAPDDEASALAILARFGPAGWRVLNPAAGWWEGFREVGTARTVAVGTTAISLYAKMAQTDDAPTAPDGDPAAAYLDYLSWLAAR